MRSEEYSALQGALQRFRDGDPEDGESGLHASVRSLVHSLHADSEKGLSSDFERSRGELRAVLSRMGWVVAQALWEVTEVGSVYFWPGYESFPLGRKNLGARVVGRDRIDLDDLEGVRESGPEREALKRLAEQLERGARALSNRVLEIPSGRSFARDRGHRWQERTSRTALYYDWLLAPSQVDTPRPFEVGGTHNWAVGGSSIRHRPTRDDPWGLTTALAVSTDGTGGQAHDPIRIVVELGGATAANWGDQIGEVLNGPSVTATGVGNVPRFWPQPYPREAPGSGPYESWVTECRDNDALRSLHRRLYSVWLAASLGRWREWSEQSPEWLRHLQKDLRDVDAARADRLETLVAIEQELGAVTRHLYREETFNCWTTLFLSKACGEAGDRDMGSAMFFTDTALSRAQCAVLAAWSANLYTDLWGLEAGTDHGARQAARTERLLRQHHSHALGTEFSYLGTLALRIEEALNVKSSVGDDLAGVAECVNLLFQLRERGLSFEESWDILNEDGYEEPLLRRGPLVRALYNIAAGEKNEAGGVELEEALKGLEPRDALEGGAAQARALLRRLRFSERANDALTRMDNADLCVRIEKGDDARSQSDLLLIQALDETFVAILSVFLQKIVPDGGAEPTGRFKGLAEHLFGDVAAAEELALDWVALLGKFSTGGDRSVTAHQREELRAWIEDRINRPTASKIKLELPPADLSWVLSGGVTAVRMFDAWVREVLMNGFKNLRASHRMSVARLQVAVDQTGPAVLRVRNTCEVDRVRRTRDRHTTQGGHYGLDFLSYVGPRLFEGRDPLFCDFDPDEDGWWLVAQPLHGGDQ